MARNDVEKLSYQKNENQDKNNNTIPKIVWFPAVVCIVISLLVKGAVGLCLLMLGGFWFMGYFFVEEKEGNKKVCKPAIIVAVVYGLMGLGAIFGFPSIIRKIPGEVFWFCFLIMAIIVFVVGIIIMTILTSKIVKTESRKLENKNFSDSDLMSLYSFNRFMLTGYYLLKAKLHNVIIFVKQEPTVLHAGKTVVMLNPEKTENYIAKYCENNPMVGKIVSAINACYYNAGLDYIMNEVKLKTEIQSSDGKTVDDLKMKLNGLADTITLICGSIVAYVGITKLMMGVYNDKPIRLLMIAFGVCVPVVLLSWLKLIMTSDSFIERHILNPFLKKEFSNHKELEGFLRTVDIDVRNLSDEDISRFLKSYIVYQGSLFKHKPKKDSLPSYFELIVTAVDKAKAADSSGGSGCGGCGGGCGGCGGCGD